MQTVVSVVPFFLILSASVFSDSMVLSSKGLLGSKRHNLQTVELSQTSVQIVSKPPSPSNGSLI